MDIDSITLIFESSDRGNSLVERDLASMGHIMDHMCNMHGQTLIINCHFADKKSMFPGLEVADLIAHTVGRQARMTYMDSPAKFKLDYEATFFPIDQIKLGLAGGMFIKSVVNEIKD